MNRRGWRVVIGSAFLMWGAVGNAQTTAGLATTVVFPLSAQTASFAGEITVFNPGPNTLTASVAFYEGNNSGSPGPKICNDITVSPGRSLQTMLATQCALASGGHFGIVVVADKAVPQANAFYGFMRVQTPQGQGFTVEGFPISNFNNQVSHATGLKRQASSPTFQTNCFVGSLDQPVDYELKLFNDTTGAQIGGTLSGSLQPFQQFRYLDVFGANGVNAPAGDQFNVRAQFTPTSGGNANLIGFCTVQDNTSFGADFRIAKSYGSPSGSFFAQGGNTFGTTAKLGTLDAQPLELYVSNQRIVRYDTKANVVAGISENAVNPAASSQTIAGGGLLSGGSSCIVNGVNVPCRNETSAMDATVSGGAANRAFASDSTVSGGFGNLASSSDAVVSGGAANTASGFAASVAGGLGNTASGSYSFAAGGFQNTASGTQSFAAGHNAAATLAQCAVFGFFLNNGIANCKGLTNVVRVMANHGFSVDWGPANGAGGGTWWVEINDITPCRPLNTYTNAYLSCSGVWTNNSDRNKKERFAAVDAQAVLAKVIALPVTEWSYKVQPEVRRIGPVAQDFHAAFGIGQDDLTIASTDEAGVAFAAIQGLHALLQEKNERIDALEKRLRSGEEQLAQLQSQMKTLLEAANARQVATSTVR